MTCNRCAREIETDSVYCRFCGAGVRPDSVRRDGVRPDGRGRLTRLPLEGRVAGVCAGVAAHLNLDPTLVRLGAAVLAIVPGLFIGGAIAYIAAWILMPINELGRSGYQGRRLMRSDNDEWIAGVCGGLAEYLGIDSTIVRVVSVILAIYPGMVVFGVITYAVLWAIVPPAPLLPMHTAPTRV